MPIKKKSRTNKVRRMKLERGIPTNNVPAEPYRRRLRAAGISSKVAVEASGGAISDAAVDKILAGERACVRRSTAAILERVLAEAESLKVPRIGVQRRLEALMWMQWPGDFLKERLGAHPNDLRRYPSPTISREMHRKVSALYDELSMKLGPSPKTRTYAQRSGFSPPLAWEEDTIDDPDSVPYSGKEKKYDWQQDYEFLLSCGVSEEQALKQLGRNRSALDKRTTRKKKVA